MQSSCLCFWPPEAEEDADEKGEEEAVEAGDLLDKVDDLLSAWKQLSWHAGMGDGISEPE